MELENEAIATLVAKRDESAFEQVFKSHFKRLHAYAFTILQDHAEAEEMVQQVFFKLWERNENLSSSGSIRLFIPGRA
jgi:RNA polymerase sigma-70 factor (ECF subfamily)